VYAIGESLLDIFFRDGEVFASRPGGSMLNTSVSLGRLGMPVYMLTEYAMDQVGHVIENFLKDNGVGLDHICRFEEGKTALALAFLDEGGEASYDFYKHYPGQRLKISLPDFKAGDIVLFGSFYALLPEIRSHIIPILKKAKARGALVIYDPNIRSPHRKEIDQLRVAILENISMADIVRGSDEDFNNIFNINNPHDAFGEVQRSGCQCLIYTMNKSGVHLISKKQNQFYKVPEIQTISTVGAGDSFNAGVIYTLWTKKLESKDIQVLPLQTWNEIIETGIQFASIVCKSLDNYIPVDFASKMRGLAE
jgi:fructokinase